MKILSFLFIIIPVVSSFGQQHLVDSIFNQIPLKKSNCKIDFITEKKFPGMTNETIVLIPELIDNGEDEDDCCFELNCHLFIVDSKTGKIKNSFFESSKTNNWISDSYNLIKISIDTIPYILSDTIRAFGVRVEFEAESRGSTPFGEEFISLFIKKDKTLNTILQHYRVNKYHGERTNDCSGWYNSESSTIMVGNTFTSGFKDLNVVIKHKIFEDFIDSSGECEQKVSERKERSVLKFNLEKYIIPK
jgi:hypothetical protein